MSENQQWEYHIEVLGSAFKSLKAEKISASLNEIGEMGWEVICLHQPQNSNRLWVTMKRPLDTQARRRRSRPDGTW